MELEEWWELEEVSWRLFFLLKQECDGEIYLAAYVEGWFYLLEEAFPVCRCVFVR